MLKNISQLELKLNDKIYRFACDIDSSIEHVKEALFQFQKYIGQVEDAVKTQQDQQKQQEDPPKEDVHGDK